MGRKKKQNILIEYNLWIVLAVIVALGFISYISYAQLVGFNPETECEKCIINWEEPKCSEECICDEYNDNVIGSWKQCFDGTCMEGDVILINDSTTHQGTKIMINHHSNCIKAHEKNECEKGNKDWVLDELPYTPEECITKGHSSDGDCYNAVGNKQICRKKGLSDLNCDELKEEYLKEGNSYCPRGQFWFLCFGRWEENKYGSKEGILMEYLRRCYG